MSSLTLFLQVFGNLTEGVYLSFDTPLIVTIDNYELKVVNLSLNVEINEHTGKAATTLRRLTIHVWEKPKLKTPTKMMVYISCIISPLLYGSET